MNPHMSSPLGVDSIRLHAFSQARDPSLSCVFVFFVGHDQLSEFFSALLDYPQLRYDSGAWVTGKARKGAGMPHNMEHIVYVWNIGSKAWDNRHCALDDPDRQVVFP